jgi:hypothetical protein
MRLDRADVGPSTAATPRKWEPAFADQAKAEPSDINRAWRGAPRIGEETSTLTPQQPVEAARSEKERPGSLAAEKAKKFEGLMLMQAKARWAELVREQAGRENCDYTFRADVMASGLTVELSAALGSARCPVLPTAVIRPPNLNGRGQSAPTAQPTRAYGGRWPHSACRVLRLSDSFRCGADRRHGGKSDRRKLLRQFSAGGATAAVPPVPTRSGSSCFVAVSRQYRRTATSKYHVRRISITSNSLASAGGNAW